ncbi:uncharacterized protein OCT59_025617 [Rhizophagus irregularis]|uniref:uncharacterized protein n=1 Tax=Rhizophagus irregularis TaxID=588596 RepID=UPI00331935A5|nr:hypothetical protein OCT59_025617 [Rhizophagus irregularis]
MKKISQYFDGLKKNLFLYLSSIENLFCVVLLAYSIVALIENIFVWISSRDFINSLDCFFNSVLVIISGIITATFRTLNHILINFIVNVTLILYTYYLYYYNVKISGSITFIVLQAIFLLLILLIVIIWLRRKSTFKKSLFANKEMDTENTKIKEIYKWYHLQLTLCHAQILVAILSQFTYMNIMISIIYGSNVGSPFDLLKYIPWPSVLLCIIALIMIKGVREESKCKMIIFYIANFTLYIYYICVLIIEINILTSQTSQGNSEYIIFILERKIDIVLVIISIFITTFTIINSIICHKNFGQDLKDYLLKEELKPFRESYDYKDDLDDYHERT